MTTITAKVITRSTARNRLPITTVLVRYPLIIHAELMTHRVFSRNAASMRAIPFDKLVKATIDDPFVPLIWTKNQPGMQGYQELDVSVATAAKAIWLEAMHAAIFHAKRLHRIDVHKQIVNRLLMPYAHITVLITSTYWANWFALRRHPKAEPHIQILAGKMFDAIEATPPRFLHDGQWHLPFVGLEDMAKERLAFGEQLRLSVARCASTSYRTVDGFEMSPDRADQVFESLIGDAPIHASPLEHQAQADRVLDIDGGRIVWDKPGLNGNLSPGWIQYRKTLANEFVQDTVGGY